MIESEDASNLELSQLHMMIEEMDHVIPLFSNIEEFSITQRRIHSILTGAIKNSMNALMTRLSGNLIFVEQMGIIQEILSKPWITTGDLCVDLDLPDSFMRTLNSFIAAQRKSDYGSDRYSLLTRDTEDLTRSMQSGDFMCDPCI